jgi:iron(II)-dependent oxidoreductase
VSSETVKSSALSPDREHVLVALARVREQTLALVAPLDTDALERVHSPLMSPLAWDLGHIAAYEDLWLAHRQGGRELLRADLAALYDAFETPRAVRGDIDALGAQEALAYMDEVRERTVDVLHAGPLAEPAIWEMVIRHELQHCETMRQTMALAGMLGADEPGLPALGGQDSWLRVGAGAFAMGAPRGGFAYDNERPRHDVQLPAFAIARRPVTNASWMHFSEGGGYERREWWSEEGWAWKEEYDITHHEAIERGHREAAACHVSWFEADAFARANGARLPSEAEWERAVTWSRETDPELAGIGHVWEWTASEFDGYPGFRAYPYREYSEVFFRRGYRVLRGGSWATDARVATPTFRNWDLPLRRQIFAGVRLAKDV